jgi:hypothetical protein
MQANIQCRSKLIVVFFLAITMFLFYSCKDSISNPGPAPSVSVLMDVHFENQGQPSLSGWISAYPYWGYRKQSYSFSNDVPANGSLWSLKCTPPDSFFSVMHFVILPQPPNSSKQFRIIYLYKSSLNSECEVSLTAWNNKIGYVYGSEANNSNTWNQDTVIYKSQNLEIDSIALLITMSSPPNLSDTNKSILFNEFKVEEY